MAALLVAMSMMAIMMTVAMPVWKQTAQREKETELIFRGTQYVHAIALFQRKTANAFPPSIDLLVDQRFLRKKYKDPITGGDFQILTAAQQGANSAAGPGQRGGQAAPGTGAGAGATTTPGATGGATGGRATAPIGTSPIGAAGVAAAGGIMGVASKSKDKSLRIYNGRTHYNEWAFLYSPPVQAPGAGGAPGAGPGRGGQPQRGQQPGQPGQQPPFGGQGPLGGQRGRGNPQPPGGRGGFGSPGGFGQPGQVQPLQPVQPTPPGRGRG